MRTTWIAAALAMAALGCRTSGELVHEMTVTDPRARAEAAAVRHWQEGIIRFQKGDYAKAREEWLSCLELDPANQDCKTALARVEDAGKEP